MRIKNVYPKQIAIIATCLVVLSLFSSCTKINSLEKASYINHQSVFINELINVNADNDSLCSKMRKFYDRDIFYFLKFATRDIDFDIGLQAGHIQYRDFYLEQFRRMFASICNDNIAETVAGINIEVRSSARYFFSQPNSAIIYFLFDMTGNGSIDLIMSGGSTTFIVQYDRDMNQFSVWYAWSSRVSIAGTQRLQSVRGGQRSYHIYRILDAYANVVAEIVGVVEISLYNNIYFVSLPQFYYVEQQILMPPFIREQAAYQMPSGNFNHYFFEVTHEQFLYLFPPHENQHEIRDALASFRIEYYELIHEAP